MRRRGRAVTGLVGGLRGNLAHHLRAHVLELVFQLDLLGGGHAVLGDAWCAKRLVQQDVTALGAERHAHRVGENIYAAQHAVASVDREFDFLGSHVDVLLAVHLHPEERPSAASRSIRPLKPLGRCRPTFGACTLTGLSLLRRRAPDKHGRGVDYSIALVERLSAFFIMLIGFEWVRSRLTPGT